MQTESYVQADKYIGSTCIFTLKIYVHNKNAHNRTLGRRMIVVSKSQISSNKLKAHEELDVVELVPLAVEECHCPDPRLQL